MSDQPAKTSVLSRETLVPVGAAIGVVLALGPALWWLQGTLLRIDNKVDSTLQRISQIERSIEVFVKQEELRNWVLLLRATNAGKIEVPDLPR
jgi:hypothetical protein